MRAVSAGLVVLAARVAGVMQNPPATVQGGRMRIMGTFVQPR